MTLWNCFHIEFVAQLEAGGAAGHNAEDADSVSTPVEETSQALPLPRGAAEYVGWFDHPDFGGCMRITLLVTCADGHWGGTWELGRQPGPRERVEVQLSGDAVTIRNVTGRHCTELQGGAASNGTLSGKVLEDGCGGGRFKLWPRAQEPLARRLQEWYVALCSGTCVDVPAHHPELGLPSECPICLEGLLPGDVIVRTACSEEGHVFHRNCAQRWLKSRPTCPLCRRLLIVAPACTGLVSLSGSALDVSLSYMY